MARDTPSHPNGFVGMVHEIPAIQYPHGPKSSSRAGANGTNIVKPGVVKILTEVFGV